MTAPMRLSKALLLKVVPGLVLGVVVSAIAQAWYVPPPQPPGYGYPTRGWAKGAHQDTIEYTVWTGVYTLNYKLVDVRNAMDQARRLWNYRLQNYSDIVDAGAWAVTPFALATWNSNDPISVGKVTFVNCTQDLGYGNPGECWVGHVDYRYYQGPCATAPDDGYNMCKSLIGAGAVSAQNASAYDKPTSIGAEAQELGHALELPDVGNCESVMSACFPLFGDPGDKLSQGDVHAVNLIHALPDAATLYYPDGGNDNRALFCFNDNSHYETAYTVQLQKWNGTGWEFKNETTLAPIANGAYGSYDWYENGCRTWTAIRTNWGTGDYRVRVRATQDFPGEAPFNTNWLYSNKKYVSDLP